MTSITATSGEEEKDDNGNRIDGYRWVSLDDEEEQEPPASMDEHMLFIDFTASPLRSTNRLLLTTSHS